MSNLLITGGSGFIGSNFIRYVLCADPRVSVVNLDAMTYAANPANLEGLSDPGRYRFVEGDICDRELVDRVMRDHGISAIAHFAAESHVDRSIRGPDSFVRTNIVGTFTLLEAARRAWVDGKGHPLSEVRFHHISTDEVYGSLGAEEPAFVETSPYRPNSPYAASKASSDHLVRAHARTYGLPVTITNCTNNYGPYQFPEKLIPLTILNALKGEAVPVYGDGAQVRDWLHVEDHCEAIWLVMRRGEVGVTYNVGGENQPTNLQIVRRICAVLDELAPDSPHVPHSGLLRFVADRPGHDRRYALDTGKIRRELGWRPKTGLDRGLAETVKWYLDNPGWVGAVVARPEYQAWIKENYRARGEGR